MITKTLIQSIASSVPNINIVGKVVLINPQTSGSITYAANSGGAVNLQHSTSVELDGITNLNQLAFTGSGDVHIVYNIVYEIMQVLVKSAISGTLQLGQTLTCAVGTLQTQTSATTFPQWLRNGVPISGATALTYVLTAADQNAMISCALQHVNTNGANTNERIDVFTASFVPVNSVAPALSGTPEVGETITTSNGTWSNAPSFTYQWFLDGVAITGATSGTYVTDAEGSLTCQVTATNAVGTNVATSNALNITQP
jgi:hypothetical protein